MTRTLTLVSAAACLVLFALAVLLGRGWLPGALLAAMAVVWILGLVRRWNWIGPAGLFAVFGFAVLGILTGLPAGFLHPAVLLGLAACDLAGFDRRLALACELDDVHALERSHFLRLAVTLLAAGVLVATVFQFKVAFKFELVVVLLLLMVWGMGRVAAWLLTRE